MWCCAMAETLSIPLFNRQQAKAALTAQVFPFLGQALQGSRRWVLSIKPETRSIKENAMLHAMLTYISKNLEWAGKKRDVDTWKRLMVAAWCRAKNEQVEILPALDGHGVDIVFRKTSKLTRAECADLIEFIFAWGSMHDFPIPDKSQNEYIDQDTGEITQ